MSFGFGVGDFLAVGNLAWRVYRSCKDLTEEFQEACREALTIHTVIRELQDEATDPQSPLNSRGALRKQELVQLIKNLERTLRELDEIVTKYQGLARRERRIWDQLRLATEDLDKIRRKLTFHITAINAFTSSLSRGTLAHIETVLVELMSEVRLGQRPSLASLHESNNDSIWGELESELAGDGISSTDIAKHKAAIKVFVRGLFSDPNAETISLVEIASLAESGNDGADSESVLHDVLPVTTTDLEESPTMANAQNCSVPLREGEEYEAADEEIPRGRVSFDNAVRFLNQVRFQVPHAYKRFLMVARCYSDNCYGISGVIDWMYVLLYSKPELLEHFMDFLPLSYKVEYGTLDNKYAFRVTTPFATYIRIPDLQAIHSPTAREDYIRIAPPGLLKWVDPASLDVLRPYTSIGAPLDWTTKQPASRISAILKEHRATSVVRLKAFLRRLKDTKEAATDTGRLDDMNCTTTVGLWVGGSHI